MEEKVVGLVIGSIAYGEYDKIITIFTLEKGVVSAKIKGVKKAGAKLKFASEPFCFAEFILTGSNFKTVINASLLDSFYPLREDIVRLYAGSAVLEIAKKFMKEGMTFEQYFTLTINALKQLAYSKENPLVLLIKYVLDTLSSMGYAINLEGCYKCGSEIKGRIFFDYLSGGFTCYDCFTDGLREVNLSTYESLRDVCSGEEIEPDLAVKCLKLLNFYLINKTEVSVKPLAELIKICER